MEEYSLPWKSSLIQTIENTLNGWDYAIAL